MFNKIPNIKLTFIVSFMPNKYPIDTNIKNKGKNNSKKFFLNIILAFS